MNLPNVQMFWPGGALSAVERLAMRSFLAHGHGVELYSYDDGLEVPAGVRRRAAAEVLPKPEGTAIGVADLFRFTLLVERGGLFCDPDVVCLKPWRFAADMPQFFAAERTPDKPLKGGKVPAKVGSCAVKLPPESDIARRALERCRAIGPAQIGWGFAGPILLTELVQKHRRQDDVLHPDVICPVDYWNFHQLFTGMVMIPDNCHGVHFWSELWRRNFFDRNGRYDPLSLVERLRAAYPE